jgi:hypothetical protein
MSVRKVFGKKQKEKNLDRHSLKKEKEIIKIPLYRTGDMSGRKRMRITKEEEQTLVVPIRNKKKRKEAECVIDREEFDRNSLTC